MLLQTLRTRDFDELVAAFPSKRTSQAPPLLPPMAQRGIQSTSHSRLASSW
jgi:hypothetical protein